MVNKPFLKWAGGKRQLLPELRKHVPKTFRHYYEPFIGAGALLFDLLPQQAVINDMNAELMNCYRVVRDNVDELLTVLHKHQIRHCPDYYYTVREWDRKPSYRRRLPVNRAARLIYLNRTCYNGLFRVNSQGQFNVPCGRYKNPPIVNENVLREVNAYLRKSRLEIRHGDFSQAVKEAGKEDFVYLDPPYDPLSETASFTAYAAKGFDREEQRRLHEVFCELDARGCKVLLSNARTPFIENLYKAYRIKHIKALRHINSNPKGRTGAGEVLVKNY